jgi:hypothetical protein
MINIEEEIPVCNVLRYVTVLLYEVAASTVKVYLMRWTNVNFVGQVNRLTDVFRQSQITTDITKVQLG